MIRMKKATLDDIDSIYDLLVDIADIHTTLRPDLFKSSKYTKEELKEMINNDDYIYVCVDESNKVLGHIFLQIKDYTNSHNLVPVKTLYIDDLCVGKEYRNKGIGTFLMDFAKDFAKEFELYNIVLNAWVGNYDAMSFYDKQGMKVRSVSYEIIVEDI